MQQQKDGSFLYSPTDLVTFLECSHTTFLAANGAVPPKADDGFAQLLQHKGLEHEKRYLNCLQSEGKHVVEIVKEKELAERVGDSTEALQAGVDVVFQAVLRDGCWRGDADFLLKCDTPSQLGNYSYEVLDTKLARTPEPKHIIQLCAYTELLAKLQGLQPAKMYLLTGDSKKHSFKVNDYFAYYRWAKQRFMNYVQQLPKESYPQPCNYCKLCHWKEHCHNQWQKDNHLSLIANIRRSQQDKLVAEGITSVAQLATLPENHQVAKLNVKTFSKLREQASLQTHKQTTGENKYKILPQAEGKGFSRIPLPQQGDLFFDMEGDPLYSQGLEYLFGVYYLDEEQSENFKTFWAHNHEQEKAAFCELMQFIVAHLKQHPDAYIYHYNHYETTALKRLACRYAYYEEQLDNLLRAEKFIDLFVVVRESIRISEPSYSLKNLETFYMPKRVETVATAADSVVVYNKWRVSQDAHYLKEIADYNEQDCKSTQLLRDWLLQIAGGVSFSQKPDTEAIQERKEWEIEYEDYRQKLENAAPPLQKTCMLLSDLLEFHRREDKSQWWRIFSRQNKTLQELLDDSECLADLQQCDAPRAEKRSQIYTYNFPPQEHKLKKDDKVLNAADKCESAGAIYALDENKRQVQLKHTQPLPAQLSIGSGTPIPTEEQRNALYRLADQLLANTEHGVAVELLKKAPTKTTFTTDGSQQAKVLQAVSGLNRSYLFIQGPPGTGKTQIAAETVVALLQQGKKIGISANAHKVIHNLLIRIEGIAKQRSISFRGIKKASKGNAESFFENSSFIVNKERYEDITDDADLFAGTAWLFSNKKFCIDLDYLFIDEASQLSLADTLAMARCASNIVLIGDQMQLGKPIKGTHPDEVGVSVLDFLFGQGAVVPADRGIFLEKTHRLHTRICAFISEVFYEGKLQANTAVTHTRSLDLQSAANLPNEGIAVISAKHAGCGQKSEVEGNIICNMFNDLLGKPCHDGKSHRTITIDDILVVAPYNAQVNYLKARLPSGARVGTIDKFQGQEALIVLISMTTSSAEYLPRNIEFLFSANRLNVALSRAQCLAVVIINPQLLAIPCRKVEQLQLVNNFCRLRLEMG